MRCHICWRILVTEKQWKAQVDRRPNKTHARHDSRGLCSRCAKVAKMAGIYDDFERIARSGQELVEEFEFLDLSREMSLTQRFKIAAPRLGVTWRALEKAYQRHKLQEES